MSRITPLAREQANQTNDRFASSLTLARWRLRQTGWLLLMACMGFVVAMIIACVVPLFTTVATAASLQTILQANPARNNLTLSINTQGLSSGVASTVQKQVTPLIQQQLSPYQNGAAPLSIQQADLQVLTPTTLQNTEPLTLYATVLDTLKEHLHLLSGRWPAGNVNELEVMLTPASADELHLTLGAQLTLQGEFTTVNQVNGPIDPRTAFNAQLVGLFEVQSPAPLALHGQDFQPARSGQAILHTMLTDTTAFLQTLDQTAARAHASAIFSYLQFQLTWDYQLQTSTVKPDQLEDLINRLSTIQTDIGNYRNNQQQLRYDAESYPYVIQVALYSPTPSSFELLDILREYDNRINLVSIPITVLALQIIALLLFFVSLLISMLLDRQTAANALLMSRGASNKQIFWSLFLQGLALCLAGIVLGPLAGIMLVSTLTFHILSIDNVHIAQSILTQPLQILSSIGPTAGGTLLAALLTIGLIVRYTAGLNMLTLRRETARTTREPFWQRYHLDLLAAVIALSGYGISLYLAGIAHEVDITTQDLILAPLTLIAPIFLLLGCLLLFLRIFPWLLRFGGWVANRGRGATSMLALVQMARAPRQIIRMTLLLSLTVAFAIFAQVFSASQTQHINDISAYESGADFSGDLPINRTAQVLPIDTIIQQYRAFPGVLAASADYTDGVTATGSGNEEINIQFRAIDPQSFAQTVIWTTQDSSQPLPGLLALLPRPKVEFLPNGEQATVLPAIIDQALANQLQLNLGSVFSASLDDLTNATLNYQVAAIVAHIPTVNANATASTSNSPGGMLVDYQQFVKLYTQTFEILQQPQQLQQTQRPQRVHSKVGKATPAPLVIANHVWLRTSDDPHVLASLRVALNSSRLAVNNLYDRREIAAELTSDPFNLNILIILGIGGVTAFLLAFIGNLVSSWLSVRMRRSSFIVLRALGSTSRQVAGVLLWEQGIVYLGAILLGLAFGAVLARVAVPVLIFTGQPEHGPMSTLSSSDLYLLQHALPPRIVVPLSLDLIFVALVLICLIALITMIRAALRPSISTELRLSED
jgi:hypothetical protein